MKNNLVPEVRPDVNGKLVTRHVKAGATSSSAASLPAPLSISAIAARYVSDVESLTEAIESAVNTGAYDDVDMVNLDAMVHTLQNMQPQTVRAFNEQIDDTPDIGYEDLLISVLVNKLPSEQAGYILFAVQSSGFEGNLSNEWDDDVQGTYEYESAWHVYRGVTDFYSRAGKPLPRDILKADAKARQDAGAVAKMLARGYGNDAAGVLMDDDNGTVYFEDTDLGVLATEYPDDIEFIIDVINEDDVTDVQKLRSFMKLKDEYPENGDNILAIMKERDTSDIGTIREVLSSEVQPLSNGVL